MQRQQYHVFAKQVMTARNGARNRCSGRRSSGGWKNFSAPDGLQIKCGLVATPVKKNFFRLKKNALEKIFPFAFSIFA
ncbi:MAG: hypothetical protein ACOY2B_11760 [Pseudomonadota bacterium]